MARRKKRQRVSKEEVRKRAAEGSKGGGSWFNLPKDMEVFTPDKPGRYVIDIVPYEVKASHHPDKVPSGALWFRYMFRVHHGVGTSGESIVCPKSVGSRCPICEEVEALRKDDYEKNREIIDKIRGQLFVMYNILSPDDPDKIMLFVLSKGKFSDILDNEIREDDEEENTYFYDVQNGDGRTLRVRFSEEEFSGNKFIRATRIDFRPRADMDEDEILDKVACLDEILTPPSYDDLLSLYKGHEEDEEEDEDEEPPESKSKSKSKSKKSLKKAEEEESWEDEEDEEEEPWEDEEDEEEDEDEEPPESKSKSKSKSKSASKPKKSPKKAQEEDDWDDDDWED
jgi:hypothetical protein